MNTRTTHMSCFHLSRDISYKNYLRSSQSRADDLKVLQPGQSRQHRRSHSTWPLWYESFYTTVQTQVVLSNGVLVSLPWHGWLAIPANTRHFRILVKTRCVWVFGEVRSLAFFGVSLLDLQVDTTKARRIRMLSSHLASALLREMWIAISRSVRRESHRKQIEMCSTLPKLNRPRVQELISRWRNS